jgi:hypothetical protein
VEWILLVLAAGGGGSYAVWRLRERRDERRERAVELEGVRRLADEDVTIFGEQLQRLGNDLADHELDQMTRDDYQAALDAYERAKWTAPRLGSIEELSMVIDTLATGRFSLACVRARVAGTPVPELRVPCFFNPQHGPSVREVMYTVPRRGTRRLPACTMCASRIQQREKPEIRTVEVGGRKVPYWEAGNAYLPYSQGYFPAEGTAAAALTWGFAATYTAPGPGEADHSGGSGDFGAGYGGDLGGGDGGGGGE